MRQFSFGVQSRGLETKLVETEDLVLHDKVIKVWVCDITKLVKMIRNKPN